MTGIVWAMQITTGGSAFAIGVVAAAALSAAVRMGRRASDRTRLGL